ncbi:hypothetical protein OG322_17450 [Streptomyces sp. NBC_01260]|uniref:hypothetical protein n=1 Tax=unclassified Streptomyces TaxID=2593676 RepID=UPI000FA922DB|nr:MULTISPECIES: hypothetical protein [unclassified Streptomyces]MCX4771100.1 hypothetical protein [Streptomyces sp. NBC_01285]ROQ81511.1 hypothetical protein EDD95_1084 [Streptomyces sp. CEV 2-1]RPK47339.1 hypothetical protein EES39_12300 [Streptomyces sp. ADI92-24]
MSGSDSTGGGALGGAEGGAIGASGTGGALPEQARVGREISRSLFGTARRRR